MNENQKQGVFVPKKQVRKDLLKEMREKVKKDLADLPVNYSDEEVLLKREKLFKKSMEFQIENDEIKLLISFIEFLFSRFLSFRNYFTKAVHMKINVNGRFLIN